MTSRTPALALSPRVSTKGTEATWSSPVTVLGRPIDPTQMSYWPTPALVKRSVGVADP